MSFFHSTPTSSAKKKIAFHPSIINQGIIDAGQKKFGAISCSICGLLYEQANDQDEKIHKEYHEHRNVLRFKVIHNCLNISYIS